MFGSGCAGSGLFTSPVAASACQVNPLSSDTRPYRLAPGTKVRSFEIDEPDTQAVKRAMLAQAGIDTSAVAFIAADFETEDWLARLVASGFDPARRTFFLWEGVIMYLDRAAIEDTLRKIAATAPGSVVAFDYFTSEALTSARIDASKPVLSTQRPSTRNHARSSRRGSNAT